MEYDCIQSTQIGTVSLMKLHLEQGFNVGIKAYNAVPNTHR